ECTREVGSRLGANMLDSATPVGPKIVVSKAVCLRIDEGLEPRLQSRPLCRIHLDLEHRILNALAEILTGLGNGTKAGRTALVGRRNIVGDEDEHGGLFPEPWRVGVDMTAQMARQHLRLEEGHEAEWRLLPEERMHPLLLLAILP